MNSIAIILKAYNSGNLEAKRAIEMINARTGLIYILAHDTGKLIDEDLAFKCEFSNRFYSSSSRFLRVNVTNQRSKWGHPDNCPYFTCNRSGENFHASNFSRLQINGETICHERFQNQVFYWDRDRQYHWEPEPHTPEVIPQYHSQRRNFSASGECFGLEIEILSKDVAHLQNIRDLCDDMGIICERDGSLDREKGVEIVFPPMSYAAIADMGGFIEKLRKYAVGWDAGTGYGLHINLNRPHYSFLQISRATVWMEENKTICEKIAGRSENRWCRYVKKTALEAETIEEDEKYEALALRSFKRLECRIFRSTLNFDSLLRNVQFLKALMDYSSLARRMSFDKFVAKQYPQFTQLINKLTRILNPVAKLQKEETDETNEIEIVSPIRTTPIVASAVNQVAIDNAVVIRGYNPPPINWDSIRSPYDEVFESLINSLDDDSAF